MHMLEEFLYKHNIDLALLQEVTNSKITTIRRYTSYINIGTEDRGTAILAKDSYFLTNIQRIPTGGGMSTPFSGIRIKTFIPCPVLKRTVKEKYSTMAMLHAYLCILATTWFWLQTLCSYALQLYGFIKCQPSTRKTGNRFGPGGRVGHDPEANDIHALYGAGSVATRQDIHNATTVEVKTGSGANSCCFHGPPGLHLTSFIFCPLHDTR